MKVGVAEHLDRLLLVGGSTKQSVGIFGASQGPEGKSSSWVRTLSRDISWALALCTKEGGCGAA